MNRYHPMSKEFQDEAKRLGLSGNGLIQKYLREGILKPNPNLWENKHIEESRARGRRNYYKRTGGTSKEKNFWSGPHFGIVIGERLFNKYLRTIFENVEYISFDGRDKKHVNFIVSGPKKEFLEQNQQNPSLVGLERDKEYKLFVSNVCLIDQTKFVFTIKYNYTPDYFVLAGWDDRVKLNLMRVWIIHRDEMVRVRKSLSNKDPFWMRQFFSVNNEEKYLYPFTKYELNNNNLYRLKEFWEEMRIENYES